jgi:putative drug exporter of the RND superfamily
LFLGFVSMSTAPGTLVKVMATGFGVGIILGATVIRAPLVPAAVSLFGSWNSRLPTAAAVSCGSPHPAVSADRRLDLTLRR